MSRTAADYMAEVLAQAGVKRIYGVVGDSLQRLHRRAAAPGLDRLGSRPPRGSRRLRGRRRGAPDRETGGLRRQLRPGQPAPHQRPVRRQRSRVPVLAIAAHIPSSEIGIDYFQATHPESLFQNAATMSNW